MIDCFTETTSIVFFQNCFMNFVQYLKLNIANTHYRKHFGNGRSNCLLVFYKALWNICSKRFFKAWWKVVLPTFHNLFKFCLGCFPESFICIFRIAFSKKPTKKHFCRTIWKDFWQLIHHKATTVVSVIMFS